MKKEALQLGKKAQELRNTGDFSEAKKLVLKVISLVDTDKFFMLGQLYAFYGQLENDLKNHDEALTWHAKALKTYEKGGFASKEMHVLRHMAEIETKTGSFIEAQTKYRTILDFYLSEKDTSIGELANTQRGYALLLEKLKNTDEAKKYWIKARDFYKELGITEGVDECENHITKG